MSKAPLGASTIQLGLSSGPQAIKLFFMLNLAKNEICSVYKKLNTSNLNFLLAQQNWAWNFFFLLITIKTPTIVGIFIFISRKNFMLNWVEYEIKNYDLGARLLRCTRSYDGLHMTYDKAHISQCSCNVTNLQSTVNQFIFMCDLLLQDSHAKINCQNSYKSHFYLRIKDRHSQKFTAAKLSTTGKMSNMRATKWNRFAVQWCRLLCTVIDLVDVRGLILSFLTVKLIEDLRYWNSSSQQDILR